MQSAEANCRGGGDAPTRARRRRTALTQETIDALRPKPGRQFTIWDPSVRGFGVRVSPAGAKTYVLKYRLPNGRVRWKSYGRFGDTPLEQARKRAERDRGLVADGRDPLAVRDEARTAPTVGAVADLFLRDHVDARRKASTGRLYRLAIDGHVRPVLGGRLIADLAPDDVVRLHLRLSATPYLGNRVLAVMSKLCSWAEQQQFRPLGSNPCRGIEKFREEKRRRYLTPHELLRLGCALRVGLHYGRLGPAPYDAIRLLLLTGARVSEILGLRWDAVDLAGRCLRLADSKTGPKTILLSPEAAAILEQRPRFAGSAYVFPGDGRGEGRQGEHRVSLADAWAWIRRRAKLPDVRLHDLRHSYASIAVSQGQSLPIVGALLGHTQPATTARYAHLMDDPLRAASDATAATVSRALNRRPA